MMIVGIGGCTALLLTGFGIKDSIADFASMQYDEILTADASMTYKNAVASDADLKKDNGGAVLEYDAYTDDNSENKEVLSVNQFNAIVFVLVLGYKQEEVSYIFGYTQPAISISITTGVKRISKYLCEGVEKNESKG